MTRDTPSAPNMAAGRRRARLVIVVALVVGMLSIASTAEAGRGSSKKANSKGKGHKTTTVVTAPPTTVPPTTVPPTTTVPEPVGDACGDTILKADGTSWECVFVDEFDGDTLDRDKWLVQETAVDGYHSGLECMTDSPDNVSVADGSLRLTVQREAEPFTCQKAGAPYETQYTSGIVSTSGKFAPTYGRFEIRSKIVGADGPGLHSALWMWPQNPYQYGQIGEIDIAEMYSTYPDRAIPFLHLWYGTGNPTATNNYCLLDVSEFHDYLLEWTEDSITISFDGTVCIHKEFDADTTAFDQPYFLVLTQALGIGGNAFDPETTPLPASTVVDHVRIWQ